MSTLDWLKFFPLARAPWNAPTPTEVRGPYFATPRPNKWYLGDNTLHFTAPWANPILSFNGYGNSVDSMLPERRNILTANLERSYGGSHSAHNDWDKDIFYRNKWYFTGPWFAGYQAALRSNGLLVSASRGSSFTEANLFHPKVFESAIANYLDEIYGYQPSDEKPGYRGPLNWRVLPLSSSIQAVVCDIHAIVNGGRDNPGLYRLVFIPVAPQKFVRIHFDCSEVSIAYDDICSKPMLALCDSIIDSLRLEVGKITQGEWDKVQATCPNMRVTKTFGELPWPLYKDKPVKKRKEVDITPHVSPNKIASPSKQKW